MVLETQGSGFLESIKDLTDTAAATLMRTGAAVLCRSVLHGGVIPKALTKWPHAIQAYCSKHEACNQAG